MVRRPWRAITDLLTGTRLEDDLPDLWSYVNLFHRHTDHISRQLDDNGAAATPEPDRADGTEVKSVELERLITLGLSLTERRTPSSTCATLPPRATRLAPAPLGGRGPARW